MIAPCLGNKGWLILPVLQFSSILFSMILIICNILMPVIQHLTNPSSSVILIWRIHKLIHCWQRVPVAWKRYILSSVYTSSTRWRKYLALSSSSRGTKAFSVSIWSLCSAFTLCSRTHPGQGEESDWLLWPSSQWLLCGEHGARVRRVHR